MEKIAEINYYETEENKKYEDLINQVLTTCFKEEKMDKLGLYVSITLTCPSYIKKINNEYRNIDKETDVLSFPMFEKNEIDELKLTVEEYKEKNSVEDLLETQKIVKEYLKTRKNPPRELILKIVDRIEIHQDKTVDLYFKLKQLNQVV